MKEEKLLDAIGMIGDDLIDEAKIDKTPLKFGWKKWTTVVAAVLAIAIIGGNVLSSAKRPFIRSYADVIYEAEYPKMTQYVEYNIGDEESYEAWWDEKNERTQIYNAYEGVLDNFFKTTIPEFLSDSSEENIIYSPINVYMALAMLAEITDGNSRQQIMNLIGTDSIEQLRNQTKAIWNSHYCDDGTVTSILANSLWLNDGIEYNKETLKLLSETYYTSSFSGEMGTFKYNNQLHSWLSNQTGGLLDDKIEAIEMKPETVMALASTIYYRAKWYSEFDEESTHTDMFYSDNGEIRCEFMNTKSYGNYYWGDRFSAVGHDLAESGCMWFILPNEDTTIEQLIEDAQLSEFIIENRKWSQSEDLKINLQVPKFDVSSQIDLNGSLKNLGVTDVFDFTTSDFSPMIKNDEMLELSSVKHGARVRIDEKGCEATAFTIAIVSGVLSRNEGEIDFIVDRPFIFVITSDLGTPLFVGVVNNP